MKGVIEKKFFEDRYEVLCSVPAECIDMRIDLFVQLHFPSFTREFIKKKIEKNQVQILTRLQGKIKPSSKIKAWDKIHIICFREKIEDEYWNGELIEFENLSYVYNHEKFCVVNKPPFMCAHPTGRHVFYCATVYAERDLHTACSTVHRLDRETSGLLVLSKDSEYGNLLSTQFEKHLVQKFYFFIAKIQDCERVITFPFCAHERLGPHPDPLQQSRIFMHCFPADTTMGKSAKTYFDVVAKKNGYLLGLAMPKSGRQHQIRAHAAHHGFPLIGDKIYFEGHQLFQKFKDKLMNSDDTERMQLPRHGLHAAALDFHHLNLAQKSFFAPLPRDLVDFIKVKIELDPKDVTQTLIEKITFWQSALKKQEHL